MSRFMLTLVFLTTLSGCNLLFEEEVAQTAATESEGPGSSGGGSSQDLDALIESAQSYRYDEYGKRDPFTRFLSRGTQGPMEAGQLALQQFEVSDYTFTGAFTDIAQPIGMVEDPRGISHVVRMGAYIGRKWGQVTRIERSFIEVTEEYESTNGDLLVTRTNIESGISLESGQ